MVRDLRENIDKLMNGFFEYETGKLSFSVPKIEESLSVGQIFDGSFILKSDNELNVRGNIYTSNMRLVCRTDSFDAAEKEIKYAFDTTGLEAGDVVKGDIQIVSNAGEYYIPFVFSITHNLLKSTLGNVRNLFHFTNQAQSNWEEAVHMYYQPSFLQVFEGNDRVHLDKYRGLSKKWMDEESVEEFLVTINKKQPVIYMVDRSAYEFIDVTEDLRCEIVLKKSTWGYVHLELSSDNPFVEMEKETLSDHDFLGNEHRLVFFIREEYLHEGNNYACIELKNIRQRLPITIVASRRKRNDAARYTKREMKSLTGRLMKKYIAFRMKQINVNVWVRESMKIVERMNSLDDKNPVSRLYQAQLLLVESRLNEAKWILEHVENEMNIKSAPCESYCYYQYLNTLYEREEDYVNQVADEVSKIYERHPESFQILWTLFYLDEGLNNQSPKKIFMIEQQYQRGCVSPILYVEAYHYFALNPSALNKLEQFELEVLLFAIKYKRLDDDVRKQLAYLAARKKAASPLLMKVLVKGYELSQDVELLDVICSLSIKANNTSEDAFYWYARGVKEELRITKLYEYYMYSIPLDFKEPIPVQVLMYFGFHNELDYVRLGLLYANLIRNKSQYAQIYESYRENILVFAVEQIHAEHIDENLAVIYQDVLFVEMLRPDMANHLSKLLFACEVVVPDPRIKKVIVLQEEFEEEREFPVENMRAYPILYKPESTIIFENDAGQRMVAKESSARKLMNELPFIASIRHYVNDNIYFYLYLSEGKRHYVVVSEENEHLCRAIVESKEIREQFKREVRVDLLRYYYDHEMMTTLDEFLTEVEAGKLNAKDRATVIHYYVRRGMYEEAYEQIVIYGAEQISAKNIVRICSQMIERQDNIVDAMLVKVCYHAFKLGKYDERTLSYLALYFNGLTKELRDLWKASREFGLDCDVLAEKLLTQMLYTRTTVGEKETIFEEYVKHCPNSKLEIAYLTYNAYDYFVKERMMSDSIFEHMIANYRLDEPLNDACRLALLKYYAEEDVTYTERIKDMLVSFIKDLLHKNIYFKFFGSYVDIVPELATFADKVIIEYRTNPKSRVMLHYIVASHDSNEDVYRTEEMRNMFGGVFYKEFILFFGENLQYYITEEKDEREYLTFSDSVSVSEAVTEGSDSRYSLLNDMVVSKTLQDDETLIKLMEEYVEADYYTQQIFTLI